MTKPENRPNLKLPEIKRPEVKRVDVEGSMKVVSGETCESCGVDEEVVDARAREVPSKEEVEPISSALNDLHVEESFVWKHGVLESWHLVGRKVGVDASASSGEKVGNVSSFEGGGKKDVRKPPDIMRIRRGRTLFDWEAFNLDMKERSRVEDPP